MVTASMLRSMCCVITSTQVKGVSGLLEIQLYTFVLSVELHSIGASGGVAAVKTVLTSVRDTKRGDPYHPRWLSKPAQAPMTFCRSTRSSKAKDMAWRCNDEEAGRPWVISSNPGPARLLQTDQYLLLYLLW